MRKTFLKIFSFNFISLPLLPTPLGKPQIIKKADKSVTLSWTRSNAVGSSSLVGYTIEMFGKNSTDSTWMQAANRIRNTTYQVDGLATGITYYFIVRAENSHGLSAPSQVSDPVTIGLVSCSCTMNREIQSDHFMPILSHLSHAVVVGKFKDNLLCRETIDVKLGAWE